MAIFAAGGFAATPYNNFVLLADAWRHGRMWIDWPGPYIDALAWGGHYFVIQAPLPAVLLLPAVALRGTAVNQSLLAALLAGLATYAAWEICRRLDVPFGRRLWLAGFLLLGTDLFWCAMLGDVWFIAHVSAVAFTLLAIRELLNGRRGWLVAIFAACAVESRFDMVLALPVYAAMLAPRRRSLATFALGLLPFALLWVAYNQARWGVPYDIGYTTWYHQDRAGLPSGSPFRLMYLSNQLYSFFVRFPDPSRVFPYLVPTFNRVALTWTSPGLVLAFFARRPRGLVVAMWAATLLTAAPNFVYYVNGYAQFGMRHALDFEPFLFVLMALAARAALPPLGAALLGYSMLAGAWGAWFWRTFYRSG